MLVPDAQQPPADLDIDRDDPCPEDEEFFDRPDANYILSMYMYILSTYTYINIYAKYMPSMHQYILSMYQYILLLMVFHTGGLQLS